MQSLETKYQTIFSDILQQLIHILTYISEPQKATNNKYNLYNELKDARVS